MKNFKLSEKRMLFGLVGLLFVVSFVHTAGILNLTNGVKSQTAQVKTAASSVKATSVATAPTVKTEDIPNIQELFNIGALKESDVQGMQKSVGDSCVQFINKSNKNNVSSYNEWSLTDYNGIYKQLNFKIIYDVVNNCGYSVSPIPPIMNGLYYDPEGHPLRNPQYSIVRSLPSNYSEEVNVPTPQLVPVYQGGWSSIKVYEEFINCNGGCQQIPIVFSSSNSTSVADVVNSGETKEFTYAVGLRVPVTYNNKLGIQMLQLKWAKVSDINDMGGLTDDEIFVFPYLFSSNQPVVSNLVGDNN